MSPRAQSRGSFIDNRKIGLDCALPGINAVLRKFLANTKIVIVNWIICFKISLRLEFEH